MAPRDPSHMRARTTPRAMLCSHWSMAVRYIAFTIATLLTICTPPMSVSHAHGRRSACVHACAAAVPAGRHGHDDFAGRHCRGAVGGGCCRVVVLLIRLPNTGGACDVQAAYPLEGCGCNGALGASPCSHAHDIRAQHVRRQVGAAGADGGPLGTSSAAAARLLCTAGGEEEGRTARPSSAALVAAAVCAGVGVGTRRAHGVMQGQRTADGGAPLRYTRTFD
mmetsp:Transcript_3502/g.9360  ORF Transcript_3502/g.9360 Transcript_3502/m.9360 type:complete len:222 (-) Transcript_3502:2123-2788(-)